MAKRKPVDKVPNGTPLENALAKPEPIKTEPAAVRIEAQIEYIFPQAASPLFANQMVVHGDEHVTYLSFFRTQPPMVATEGQTLEQMKKTLAEIRTVPAHLVSQIVIPRARLADFARVLTNNAEAFRKIKEELQ